MPKQLLLKKYQSETIVSIKFPDQNQIFLQFIPGIISLKDMIWKMCKQIKIPKTSVAKINKEGNFPHVWKGNHLLFQVGVKKNSSHYSYQMKLLQKTSHCVPAL